MGFNSDNVEATKSLKYTVKRDLSGDVQFVNLPNVGAAMTSLTDYLTGSASETVAIDAGGGWEFIVPGQIKLSYTGYIGGTSWVAQVKFKAEWRVNVANILNSLSVLTTFTGDGIVNIIGTLTGPVPAAVTRADIAPNTINNRVFVSIPSTGVGVSYFIMTATANEKVLGQKNDLTIVNA